MLALLAGERDQRPAQPLEAWLVWTYIGVVAVVWMVLVAVTSGWTPVFFVQGEGVTAVRQNVLGSAIALFSVAAAACWWRQSGLLMVPSARSRRRM